MTVWIPTLGNVGGFLLYYLYIVVASLLIPGPTVKGHPNPKRGPQLTYKIIGFKLTCLTIIGFILFSGMIPQLSWLKLFDPTYFAKNFWALFITVNTFCLIVSLFLYVKGRFGISILGEAVDRHTHGSVALDFWVGRQLNPRIGSYDIKFNAYRVGMLLWLILNLSFLAQQLEQQGTITLRMLGYQFASGFYVLDYFYFEQKMLTTWDIISEQFGYMLVFGDYLFIPFTFSIQCHYLVQMTEYSTPYLWLPLQLVLFFTGYYIFRTANSQKNQYKTDPNQQIQGKKPETIGNKILVSGFWGRGRHMNYTGDLMMAFAYCMPCGITYGPKPYFYFIYLTTLLLHRAYRDDTKCSEKYGKLWEEYCRRVPYVFVPHPIDNKLQAAGKLLYGITNPRQKSD